MLFISLAMANDNTLPATLTNVGIEQRLDSQIPLNLEFRDEKGSTRALENFFDGKRPVILSLVYYECPMLCTEVLNGMLKTLKIMPMDAGKEFEVLTISFDPRETPQLAAAKKTAYIESYKRPGAAEGWHFLTGKEESIRELTKAAGFKYTFNEANGEFAHGAAIMVLTPQGRISRYLYGIEYSPRDLRLALVEASEGKIGTFVDQVLLYCFHYDPTTGKYSAYALNLVRLGGILTVIALGVFIMSNRRKKGP